MAHIVNGFGLMSLTNREPSLSPSQDQAFACLQAALDAGATHWNGSEFYGGPDANSLTLLKAFYEAYPDTPSKVTLNIKGALDTSSFKPACSAANVRRSVEDCLRMLGPRGRIDMFECARRDPDVPLGETFGELNKLVLEGKIGGVALSEVNANTIREAAKYTKISAVEIELSLSHTEPLRNGIAEACKDLDIPIYAYSPLGRRLLTGTVNSLSDLPEKDWKRLLPRFQEQHLTANLRLVEAVKKLASSKGCTPSQLALSWLHNLSEREDMPTIIPIPGTSRPERVKENAVVVQLSEAEMKVIDEILAQFPVSGGRYPEALTANLDG